MRKLILKNFQSPGDIVMLTAAVRDLHRSNPGQFMTDVRTPCPDLWTNNPYITPLCDDEPEVETIDCHYPLIHQSNTGPWHFIHGFSQYLSERLSTPIRPTLFKGDIHISQLEKGWFSQVHELLGESVPFWIVIAGGKYDFTAKWWHTERYQAVVDYFKGKILFVQVGESGHYHPPLSGVLDLRGKTDLRQLVRLVYHSQGVLCPITLLMHLAAAVETPNEMPRNRACVVIAGGREPAQWEAYPHHQFIHTNGALPCCDSGGCWKARVAPMNDGSEHDRPENLCVTPVAIESHSGSGAVLPRCLHIITPEEVIRRIELYFAGGALQFLSKPHAERSLEHLRSTVSIALPVATNNVGLNQQLTTPVRAA